MSRASSGKKEATRPFLSLLPPRGISRIHLSLEDLKPSLVYRILSLYDFRDAILRMEILEREGIVFKRTKKKIIILF